jgi:Predicted Zn-dependent peptidases
MVMTQATRKSAPEPLAPIAFNTPAPYTAELANGLKIVIFEDKRFPLVSYRLALFSGDANEPEDFQGISSAVAAMLSEGTRNFSSRELAEKIERLGASISASSSDDFTMVAASSLSLYNSELLDLMSEMVLQPNFPENELDLYKRNTIEHLKFQRSQPGFLAGEQTARILYGEHPYAKTSPSPEDVEKLTRQALVDFHNRTYLSNNAILIVVGDVDLEECVKDVDERFKRWQPGEVEAAPFPSFPASAERTLTIVDRVGSAQSNIVLANLAIERKNPDYFPFLVMNQVLGAGASSRMFMNLREEKGYTYGAYTRFDAKRLGGDFEATAEVRTAVTGDSLKEFFYELDRIRNERVSDQELADAKNFLIGVFPIRAETQEGLTNLIVSQYLHGLPTDYLQTYREKVSAVTADDLERVAKKYIHPEKLAIVIVGDASEILLQAESYTDKVQIFDTNGNVLDRTSYFAESETEPADVSGGWDLSIDFQGQQIPVSLTLVQNGSTADGSLETMLGTGEISGGKINGNKLSAAARTEIQGETVEFIINGTISGDTISGTLSAPIVPEPLAFTGNRSR